MPLIGITIFKEEVICIKILSPHFIVQMAEEQGRIDSATMLGLSRHGNAAILLRRSQRLAGRWGGGLCGHAR